MKKPKTIGEYIDAAPKEAQKRLREMRTILRKAAPGAVEAIKWGSPVFETKRILFAFNAIKGNVSFMPTPSAIREFAKELKDYKTGEAGLGPRRKAGGAGRRGGVAGISTRKLSVTASSIKFPLDKTLPAALIRKVAMFRIKEVKEKDARWM